MYDALLEEFEDEAIRTPDDEESLRSLPLEEVDDSDDDDLIEPANDNEPEIQELKDHVRESLHELREGPFGEKIREGEKKMKEEAGRL